MGHDHDHTHEPFDSPGLFAERESMDPHRDFADRAFTVGIGGPVGSGKTALLQALCERLRDEYSLGVVTNDIFTREDAEFLLRHDALEQERIVGVETGGCPHAAIREDISLNLNALEDLMDRDAKKMRGEGPTVFACIKDREGLEAIVEHVLTARERALLSEAQKSL